MLKWITLIGLILLIICTSADARGRRKPPRGKKHDSKDPMKCTICAPAYEKALQATRKNLSSARFPTKMMMGWVLLADGRYPEDVENVKHTAINRWQSYAKNVKHGTNWGPALAGTFLAEYYKYHPSKKLQKVMTEIVMHFEKQQEPSTGCWGKWLGQGLKGYPVKDMGMLSCVIFGYLHTVKKLGIKVSASMLAKADARLLKNLGGGGMSYGTGQRGPDQTGGRGGAAMRGLAYAGMRGHRIYTVYKTLLPRRVKSMDKGHHIGGFHCQCVVLGCFTLGPRVYRQLTDYWVDKLIDMQDADGGVYIGDDGADGGEKGLLGGNHASTGAFALMLLLQDPNRLKPGKKLEINWTALTIPVAKTRSLKHIIKSASEGKLDKALKTIGKIEGARKVGVTKLRETLEMKALILKHGNEVFAKAESCREKRELLKALDIYEALAKNMKTHETGQKAQKAIDAINADEKLKAEVEAEKALIAAFKATFKDGLDKTTPKFQAIIDNYPDTRAAQKAKATIE